MNASEYCTVVTTTDNKKNAETIARTLLEEKLAACVQSFDIVSTYRWQGEIVTSKEIRLEIKTKCALFSTLKERIETLHSYDVPEILSFAISDANLDYLRWIDEETDR
jgi:periplasmic divalent cation tolerance protein